MFNLQGKVAIVTGGAGVLGSTICRALVQNGASVAVLGRTLEKAEALVKELKAVGGQAIPIQADVLDKNSLEIAAQKILDAFGHLDILINSAGGNRPEATAFPGERTFFDLPQAALEQVFDLNLIGTMLASQVFGAVMVKQSEGVILNISSMASFQPLTRVVAYSAAKAALNNFTQWLAVYLAQEYSPTLRVNAIAPGFFIGEQNRYLLFDQTTGELTLRGQQIITHTPMARFGEPEELIGTVLWLVSSASRFVTGIVVPVDGGFSAYSGV